MIPDLITQSLSPALVISSVGLLILSMSNRINTIGSRIRQLNATFSQPHTDEEKDNITRQLQCLLQRGRMTRDCLFALFSAICCMVFTMLILALSHVNLISIPSYLSVIPFLLGLMLILLAAVIGMAETSLNIEALKLDIDMFVHITSEENAQL